MAAFTFSGQEISQSGGRERASQRERERERERERGEREREGASKEIEKGGEMCNPS